MSTDKLDAGGNLEMDKHLIQGGGGVETLIATSCHIWKPTYTLDWWASIGSNTGLNFTFNFNMILKKLISCSFVTQSSRNFSVMMDIQAFVFETEMIVIKVPQVNSNRGEGEWQSTRRLCTKYSIMCEENIVLDCNIPKNTTDMINQINTPSRYLSQPL